jgi:predicted lipid-binding transport protein (Tim44 family)
MFLLARNDGRGADWIASGFDRVNEVFAPASSSGDAEPSRATSTAKPRASEALAELTEVDPGFSLVLFEDFLQALYARAHDARGKGKLFALSPWLTPNARAGFHAREAVTEVQGVVIGAVRIVDATVVAGAAKSTVYVDFESNFTEVVPSDSGASERTVWAHELWALTRRSDAASRAPDKVRVFVCPSCGAPLDGIDGSRCKYCDQVVDTGDFDWLVTCIHVHEREERPPQLVADVVEQGTDAPTVFDPQVNERLRELGERDPSFTFPGFLKRVTLVFDELQAAWSSQEWRRIRPFVSDSLFQTQLYWIQSYQRSKLRNVTERSRVTNVDCVAVRRDRFFDAVTIRLFATGLDYTLSVETGQVLCGSRVNERRYSEYWTFIRSASRTGDARVEPTCPNCGGGLSVGMAGECDHCGVKVASGDFDWVLSRIEQDEAYGVDQGGPRCNPARNDGQLAGLDLRALVESGAAAALRRAEVREIILRRVRSASLATSAFSAEIAGVPGGVIREAALDALRVERMRAIREARDVPGARAEITLAVSENRFVHDAGALALSTVLDDGTADDVRHVFEAIGGLVDVTAETEGHLAYNMACAAARLGDKERMLAWLRAGKRVGDEPRDALTDKDFAGWHGDEDLVRLAQVV